MKFNVGVTEYNLNLLSFQDLQDGVAEETECQNVFGYCHPILNVINVSKDIPKQSRKQVFWHEVTHAILYEIGQGDLYYDEDFVDALSKQIYGVFKNNKLDKVYSFLEGK